MISQTVVGQARKADLVKYLQEKGYKLKKEGRQYRLEGMSGLIVMGNYWYWHSRQEGGNTLDFLIRVEGTRFQDAVKTLTEDGAFWAGQPDITPAHVARVHTTVVVPGRNDNNSRMLAYLIKMRGICPDVLLPLVHSGLIYEAKGTHNCIFLGIDHATGKIRHVFQRATNSWSNIKYDSRGSDKRFSFSLTGSSQEAFAFESSIDLLSYLSLRWTPKPTGAHYVSLGGLTDAALSQCIANNKIMKITFCLDNDLPGNAAYMRLQAKYQSTGFYTARLKPQSKDWNELLVRPP